MELRYKRLLAKEILVIMSLVIGSFIVYLVFTFHDKNIRKNNEELSFKIKNISREIQIKTDSLANLHSPIVLTEVFKLLKPWETFDKNGKSKFDPIYDEFGIKKKINSQNDSLKSISLNKQILNLCKQRRLFERQTQTNIDIKSGIQKWIIILLGLAYPMRFLILGTLWSIKILKKKEN